MDVIAGFPFLALEFTKDGVPNAAQKAAFLAALVNDLADVTDLLVLSHGWNNDMADARALYTDLLGQIRPKLDGRHPPAAGRRFAVLGIFWPSMRFADAELIPGGQDGGSAALDGREVPDPVFLAAMDRFTAVLEAEAAMVAPLREAAEAIDDGPDARGKFVYALRRLLPGRASPGDDDGFDPLFDANGNDLFAALTSAIEIRRPADAGDGGAAGFEAASRAPDMTGAAADLGGLFNGARAAAFRLMNFATYYVMKERAGIVGAGLNMVLAEARGARSALNLHLVGHSFGARVVTAAVNGPVPVGPASLSLLQGAFSHNGFASGRVRPLGFFRSVLTGGKVDGPIIVTHTRNDLAVGIAYALASRLANQVASGLGGPDDVFGGLGRNGALGTDTGEAEMATLASEAYDYPPFRRGIIYNLEADAYITNHSDVANAAVANAIVHALG